MRLKAEGTARAKRRIRVKMPGCACSDCHWMPPRTKDEFGAMDVKAERNRIPPESIRARGVAGKP